MLVPAVLVGLVIGATLGALGGGGSILTVPALVYLLGQEPHGAVTGSLVVVAISASAGAAAHLRAGRVRLREGLVFGALGVAGSVAGSRLSSGVAPAHLLAGFSVLVVAAATAMFVRARRPAVAFAGAPPPRPDGAARLGAPLTSTPVHLLVMVATAGAVGLLTGFFGVGGGFVVVPALVLVMGFDMPAAVATSLLVIAINSGAALIGRIGVPVHVDWAVVGLFTASAVGASIVAARLPARVDPRRTALAFSVLLVAVGLYTLTRSVLAM